MEIGVLLFQRVLSQLLGAAGTFWEMSETSAWGSEPSPPPTMTYGVSLLCEPLIVVRRKTWHPFNSFRNVILILSQHFKKLLNFWKQCLFSNSLSYANFPPKFHDAFQTTAKVSGGTTSALSFCFIHCQSHFRTLLLKRFPSGCSEWTLLLFLPFFLPLRSTNPIGGPILIIYFIYYQLFSLHSFIFSGSFALLIMYIGHNFPKALLKCHIVQRAS